MLTVSPFRSIVQFFEECFKPSAFHNTKMLENNSWVTTAIVLLLLLLLISDSDLLSLRQDAHRGREEPPVEESAGRMSVTGR